MASTESVDTQLIIITNRVEADYSEIEDADYISENGTAKLRTKVIQMTTLFEQHLTDEQRNRF